MDNTSCGLQSQCKDTTQKMLKTAIMQKNEIHRKYTPKTLKCEDFFN